MPVWHCEDCHRVGFYFTDEQKDAVIKEHGVLGHEKGTTMSYETQPIERIHPYDFAEILNAPIDDVIDVLRHEEDGETVFEFPRTGKRYIQDPHVPCRASRLR
jgi:hypothetical protein